MKKILLILLLAGTAVCAQAQVQFGPKLGLNLTKMSTDDPAMDELERTMGTGVNFGAAMSIDINEMFSFAPELSFSRKGEKFTYEFTEGDPDMGQFTAKINMTLKLNYIDMPLLVRATFGDNFKWYLNAGPTLGYWAGGKVLGSVSMNGMPLGSQTFKIKFVDGVAAEPTEESDYMEISKDDANRFEVGASFGGGAILPVLNQKLLIDARYTLGLTDMANEMEGVGSKLRNNVASFSVIYLFSK